MNPENDSAKAFEEAWSELKAPQNETVTSKWYFKQGYEAAERRLLLSRVVMPERKPDISKTLNPDVEEMISFEGFNDCLDQIKLLPLTAEQVDSFFPSEYENSEAAKTFCQTMEAKSGFLYGVQWLRAHIAAKLGEKKDGE